MDTQLPQEQIPSLDSILTSEKDSNIFFSAIETPAPPNNHLLRAVNEFNILISNE